MGIKGCLHVFATVLCATINTAVHVYFLMRMFIFTGYMCSSGIDESYGNCNFSFLFCFVFKKTEYRRDTGGRFKKKGIYDVYLCVIHVEV